MKTCTHFNSKKQARARKKLQQLAPRKLQAKCHMCITPRAPLWLCLECCLEYPNFFCPEHFKDPKNTSDTKIWT